MNESEQSNSLSNISFLGKREHFPNHIDGIYGSFTTPAGTVNYLQTKAKLGADGSKHAQLIKALVPAREALNIQEMDFNQLLQRDLDDHRIATTLIPYILNPPINSLPGFFPPIVTVLLPFNNQQQPEEYFVEPKESIEVDHQYGLKFRMISHDGAYRVQYAIAEDNEPLAIPIAVLRWNPDNAKLVIMDGQHRAMSLLAIERTINKSWHTAPKGARYQPFYEEHVEKWLMDAAQTGKKMELNQIELPVTICWFPESQGQNQRPRPHMSARKLFVDVNNTAKPPSEARLVLLSDTKLENIFSRELLNQLRRDNELKQALPLYCVEYDNPNSAATSPRRWSVVTNLEILKDAVVRTVFGPPKIIENMGASLKGQPALKDMDRFMRKQLAVDEYFAKEIHDDQRLISRDQLGNLTFPINNVELHNKLLTNFYVKWGKGLLHLISSIEPFEAHIKALKDRYTDWTAADNVQTLAKDALFEGVGMFWTIEDGHKLWVDQKKEAKESKLPEPSQPDVSKAWKIIDEEQKREFRKRRAKIYLNTENDDDIKECDLLFDGLITYAAQVGLVLTWVTTHRMAAKNLNPSELAKIVATAINNSLKSGPIQSRTRKLILLKKSSRKGFHPINMLPSLEPAFALYYRYFWLELLCFNNAEYLTSNGIDFDILNEIKTKARQVYLNLLIDIRKKHHLKDQDIKAMATQAEQNSKALDRAKTAIIDEQAKAYNYWFGNGINECKQNIILTINNTITNVDDDDLDVTSGADDTSDLVDDDKI